MSKVVGVKIATKSPHTQNKIYYYKTEEDLKRGQNIRIETDRGGTPIATVTVQNSKKNSNKELENLVIKR